MGNEKNIDDFLSSIDEDMDTINPNGIFSEGSDSIFDPDDNNAEKIDPEEGFDREKYLSQPETDTGLIEDSGEQLSAENSYSPETISEEKKKSDTVYEPVSSIGNDTSAEQNVITENNLRYSVKGTRTWNTREPYIIPVDSSRLQKDIDKINSSFCMIAAPYENETEFKRYINREMLKFMSHGDSSILDKYTHFLYTEISNELQGILDFFKPDESLSTLFVYHLGPASIFRIITSKFNSKNFGHCCMLTEDKKTIKFLPDEYLKDLILNWFEENINILDIQFDGIKHYESVKGHVSKYYNSVLSKFNQRHYEINSKAAPGKNISKNELLRIKGDKWFGSSNIIVYKRFLVKTIFP